MARDRPTERERERRVNFSLTHGWATDGRTFLPLLFNQHILAHPTTPRTQTRGLDSYQSRLCAWLSEAHRPSHRMETIIITFFVVGILYFV